MTRLTLVLGMCVLGVAYALALALGGAVAGAIVDVVASGVHGPSVFPTALGPPAQGALAGGCAGLWVTVIAVRRAISGATAHPAFRLAHVDEAGCDQRASPGRGYPVFLRECRRASTPRSSSNRAS